MVGTIVAGVALNVLSQIVITIGELIVQLVNEEVKPILEVKENLKEMENEVSWLRALLKDVAAKARESDRRLQVCIAQLEDIVYQAEDCIDSFAVEHSAALRHADVSGIDIVKLREFAKKLKELNTQISTVKKRLEDYGVKDLIANSSSDNYIGKEEKLVPSYSHLPGPEDVVGLGEVTENLVAKLVDEANNCPVISICGMSGIGKTTLARKIYQHQKVRGHFKFLVWVHVSKNCNRRNVWETVLFNITSSEEREKGKLGKMADEELAKMVYSRQVEEKVMVVLDDVWSVDDWASISAGFPLGSESKLLLTSCNQHVAEFVHSRGFIFELGLLSNEDSWKLFQNRTQGVNMNKRREKIAKELVDGCGGLPLGIVALGGVLRSLGDWDFVNHNFISCMKKARNDDGDKFFSELASSYYSLPDRLKPCFLYMGLFPSDISAERLTNLWVAEGTVIPKQWQEETVEDVAYRYLSELEKMYMIQVDKSSSSDQDSYGRSKIITDYLGRIKNCRLHPLMRQLCLVEATREAVFRPIDIKGGGEEVSLVASPPQPRTRRIAIYFRDEKGCYTVIDGYPSYRSIVCFSTHAVGDKEESVMKSILETSRLLRVLDVEGIQDSDCPENIGELIKLRYLNLKSAWLGGLNQSVGKLKNLLTLNLDGDVSAGGIPDVISDLKGLRHLYLPININEDKTKKLNLANLTNLQTLINFPTSVADLQDLSTLKSLSKLSIHIHDRSSFDKFQKLFTQAHFNNLQLLSLHPMFDLKPTEIQTQYILVCCPRLCVMTLNDVVIYEANEA